MHLIDLLTDLLFFKAKFCSHLISFFDKIYLLTANLCDTIILHHQSKLTVNFFNDRQEVYYAKGT